MQNKFFRRAIGALACIFAFSQFGTSLAIAQDSASHIPGAAGYGDIVPADLRVPMGSPGADMRATPDAQGMVPHVCAGRKLLHHSHVDAAYVTKLNDELTVTVVDGRSVVQDPNSVCVRLAPDARSADGQEVSRMLIPNDSKYNFLGQPGEIIWRAPQEQIDDWRPVWAGIGAFDTAHEVSQPEDISLDEVRLELAEKTGPGAVEVWRTAGTYKLNRGISSETKLTPLVLGAGSHGHWNWTFSQPGVYHLGMVASYTQKETLREVRSDISDTIWLVGSDEEVGLPAGTTSKLTPIKQSAEDVQQAMLRDGRLPAAGSASAADTTAQPRELSRETARQELINVLGFESRVPQAPTAPQEITFAGSLIADDSGKDQRNVVKLEALNSGQSFDGTPVIEVPDSLKVSVDESAGELYHDAVDGKIWVLPASGGNGSVNFDFTGMPNEKRSEPIVYMVDYTERPDGSRYLAGSFEDGVLKPQLDTNLSPNRAIVNQPVAVQLSHVFTRPGIYKIGYSVEATDHNGNMSYDSREAFFVVGNASIDAVREISWERAKKDDPDTPEPKYLGADSGVQNLVTTDSGNGDSNSSTLEDNGSGAENASASGSLESGVENVSLPANDFTIIHLGHMDQAIDYDGAQLRAFLDDTANPKHPVVRESGTFGYAVPSVTFEKIPADARGYENLRKIAPEGVWSLPETQLDGIPWVGFSTQRIDYSLLSEKGVTLTLANFVGPGTMITGQNTLIDGFVTRLDSRNPAKVVNYLVGSHDHQAFYFTKEGNYRVDFRFTMHLRNGGELSQTLRAYFIVGDDAIAAAANTAGQAGGEANNGNPVAGDSVDQALPIDELVKKLNAQQDIFTPPVTDVPIAGTNVQSGIMNLQSELNQKLPGAAAANSSTNSQVPQESQGTTTFSDYGNQSGTEITGATTSTTPAGTATSSGSVGGAITADGSGLGTQITGIASGDAANAGANGSDSAEVGNGEGAGLVDSSAKVKSLKTVEKPVSSLLNPKNGAANYDENGVPWWQWILLGIAGVCVLGAVVFLTLKAERARSARVNR